MGAGVVAPPEQLLRHRTDLPQEPSPQPGRRNGRSGNLTTKRIFRRSCGVLPPAPLQHRLRVAAAVRRQTSSQKDRCLDFVPPNGIHLRITS